MTLRGTQIVIFDATETTWISDKIIIVKPIFIDLHSTRTMPKRSRTPTLRYVSHTADGRPASTAEIFTYTLYVRLITI